MSSAVRGGASDLGVDFVDDADSDVSAVWPFFGQFIAQTSPPVAHRWDIAPTPPRSAPFASPRPTLESVYGAGPVGSPYPYSKDDPAKLLLSPMGRDVPRNPEGIALIGDPRNDVHLFSSQMVVAVIKLHNRLVDRLRHDEVADQDIFEQVRRAASWHYQHVILREFLPRLIGAQLAAELLDSVSSFVSRRRRR